MFRLGGGNHLLGYNTASYNSLMSKTARQQRENMT
jgi:hypothetical protein